MSITFDDGNTREFIDAHDRSALAPALVQATQILHSKSGPGSEFTGWLNLPGRIEQKFCTDLKNLAREVQKNSDCLISIGIGGSYLGIRAAVEFLNTTLALPIHYAGHHLSSDELFELLSRLKDKRVSVIVISKSGTTTEPALAFRVIKKWMQEKYSDQELKKRIICVTDAQKGALRRMADQNGYRSFVIPDDVGGRFSILTPVGLVPLALAGVDVDSLVAGARAGEQEYQDKNLETNTAVRYAALRHLLYSKGKKVEVFASFYPQAFYLAEWWKQLFGESEGKGGRGIFPASVVYTSDLHSMGQWMQDGERSVFETFLLIDRPAHAVEIPSETEDADKFNFVAGKTLDYVNKQAYQATAQAHCEGGVPNMALTVCQADAFHLGQLFYFFEKAVAVSGYLLGVNPFDQPGVEAYKKKMFTLLGRKT